MRRPQKRRGSSTLAGLCAIAWLVSLNACAAREGQGKKPQGAPPEPLGAMASTTVSPPDRMSVTTPEPKPEAPAFVKWCASGGAPIVGAPVVDELERTYVATSDGYLHAFERDGRFRWSYTVKGTPLGSVSLRPSDGAILVGTTERFIYAINQNGGLRFRYPTLTPVFSGLHALNETTVVFLGHDTRLYAISNTGARLYRVRAPSGPMGEPVVAPGDVVWLPLEDGVARFESAFKLDRFALPFAVEAVVPLGTGAVARGAGKATFVSLDGRTEELGAARFVSSAEGSVVIVRPDGTVVTVNESFSMTELTVDKALMQKLSAPPEARGSALWLPLEDGRLVVVTKTGNSRWELQLDRGPLSTPVIGRSGTWALVPSRGGDFCAVETNHHGPLFGVSPRAETSANSAASAH